MKAGKAGDWSELLTSDKLNAWQECNIEVKAGGRRAREHRAECVAQERGLPEADQRASRTAGRSDTVVRVPSLASSPAGRHLVGFDGARRQWQEEEGKAVQLVVRGVRRPVRLEEIEQSAGLYRTVRTAVRRRCFGHAPPNGACAHLMCSFEPLTKSAIGR